jgi:Xaa-Pro aminopeptidase
MSSRLDRLRAMLDEKGLDGIIITEQWNRRWLTGYTDYDHGPNESGGIALVGPDHASMVLSSNNTDWAASDAPDFEISEWTRPWSIGVAKTIKDLGWKRVGFEDQALIVAYHQELTSQLGGAAELVPVGTATADLRMVKDAEEMRLLERAIAITDQVFTEAAAALRPGMTEAEVARHIEDAYVPAGADGVGFHTIVASGPHAARPHHKPGDRQLQEGEPIIIDMGGSVGGYTADLTRTVWLGEPSAKLREINAIVAQANDAAIAGLKAGLTGVEGDALARNVIAAAGYGDNFTHGLGHGIGLRVHEGPSMSKKATEPLPTGSVITIEPGVYIPGWGGVRIEDVVEIKDGGVRVLTHAPKQQ